MKKITVLLLCFLTVCIGVCSADAAGPKEEKTSSIISLSVPATHKITVSAEKARVFYQGLGAEEFEVARLSCPRLLVRAESGSAIDSVVVNGVDVTDQLHGGYLELSPVYEDQKITVTTVAESVAPKDTYTVKGKVSLNGQPLAEVDLELRSTLKTTKTDKEGGFVFTEVEAGEHSLTALKDGEVIGYLSFALNQDNKTDVTLLEDGTYSIFLDQNSAGMELHLVLNRELGSLTPAEVQKIETPTIPETGEDPRLQIWRILLVLSASCIVGLEAYRRRKKRS